MLKAAIIEGTERPNEHAVAVCYSTTPTFPDGTADVRYHVNVANQSPEGVWSWVDMPAELVQIIGQGLIGANAVEGVWFWCIIHEMPDNIETPPEV